MSEPLVVAILLTKDRPAMTKRAVESFRRQTYTNKRLLIWDTGELDQDLGDDEDGLGEVVHIPAEAYRDNVTIGQLRNEANAFWNTHDIVCHFDSDDYSHANRIAEQVALLHASGADCVGYRDMLFWREAGIGECPKGSSRGCGICNTLPCICEAQAWIYANKRSEYAVGTSLMYWRRTWERKPFRSIPHGQATGREDSLFIQGLKMATENSVDTLANEVNSIPGLRAMGLLSPSEPRMIASIHAGNLNPYNPEASPSTWRRAPEFDSYCRKAMNA